MANLIVTVIVKLLLRLVPGIGPIAPAIATAALKLGAAEAGTAFPLVRQLVAEAAADHDLTNGAARFAWVLPRAVDAVAKAQPGITLSMIRTMIETAVQELD